jgi:hypothetical protein
VPLTTNGCDPIGYFSIFRSSLTSTLDLLQRKSSLFEDETISLSSAGVRNGDVLWLERGTPSKKGSISLEISLYIPPLRILERLGSILSASKYLFILFIFRFLIHLSVAFHPPLLYHSLTPSRFSPTNLSLSLVRTW